MSMILSKNVYALVYVYVYIYNRTWCVKEEEEEEEEEEEGMCCLDDIHDPLHEWHPLSAEAYGYMGSGFAYWWTLLIGAITFSWGWVPFATYMVGSSRGFTLLWELSVASVLPVMGIIGSLVLYCDNTRPCILDTSHYTPHIKFMTGMSMGSSMTLVILVYLMVAGETTAKALANGESGPFTGASDDDVTRWGQLLWASRGIMISTIFGSMSSYIDIWLRESKPIMVDPRTKRPVVMQINAHYHRD